MQITRIEIRPYRIELREPFVISLGTLTHAENVYVEVHTDSGLRGAGECSPFLSINGENQETCVAIGKLLANGLEGKDPLDLDGNSALMDRLVYGNTSIKSAIDIALHDIAARHDEVPLYKFLGAEMKRDLVTDYTVSLGSPFEMAEKAAWIRESGFPVIKVKVGGDPDEDIERITLIRERIGREVPLRLDANQGWTVDQAIEVLQAVGKMNIQFCEEPIPRWEYTSLRWVRENSPVPIMADESCLDQNDALRLINLHAVGMFNLKLGKSSGIWKAMKILKLAAEHNIQLQIGGFLESRLGFTAAAHLALASKQVRYCDFDSPLMFREDPVTGGIQYGPNGTVIVPDTPGLGAFIE